MLELEFSLLPVFQTLSPFSPHFPTWPWQKKEKEEPQLLTVWDSHNCWLCQKLEFLVIFSLLPVFQTLSPFSPHFPTWPRQKERKRRATIVDCVRAVEIILECLNSSSTGILFPLLHFLKLESRVSKIQF